MQKLNDLSRSLAPLEPDGTLIAVIEMSQSSWLVAGIVPGVERQPLKKLAADEIALLKLLHRWREEAEKAGRRIERTAVAFEAGRDGFWLARWLRTRSIEAHVIHASSVAVSREHRRAKTDRLDSLSGQHTIFRDAIFPDACARRWWEIGRGKKNTTHFQTEFFSDAFCGRGGNLSNLPAPMPAMGKVVRLLRGLTRCAGRMSG